MRICVHLIKGVEKECALGISPLKCSGCSMFQLKSRRSSQQPIIETVDNVSVVGVNSEGYSKAVLSPESTVFEQRVNQASAIKGGCGCRKG